MKKFAKLLLVAVLVTAAVPVAAEEGARVNTNWFGVAIKGYDPVAYFTEDRAVEGSKEFEHHWRGAKWRFSSAANRDRFAAAPEKYAPQYGGH